MQTNNAIQADSGNLWLQRFLRLVLGGLFIYVGYAKLDHGSQVAENLFLLGIFPWGLVNIMAMWLLCFEIFIGFLVILGVWLRACSIMLIGFCLMCIGLITFAIASKLELHCGCYVTGPTGPARDWLSLWQEVMMLAGCVWLWTTSRTVAHPTEPRPVVITAGEPG